DGRTSLACDPLTLQNARYGYSALYNNNVQGALATFQKEAPKKCPMTDYWLAYILLQTSPPARDTARGAALMEQAAKNGYPEAMYSLGFVYVNGLGGKKDETVAREWLNKAGAAGVPAAYTLLGTMDEKTNPARALTYYQRAADQGEPVAMYNLALLYRDGRGVAKNDFQFNTWLNLSALRQYQPAKQLQADKMKKKE
ncbi:MAG: tetratricopeptide repeat protein, partial [Chitinophagaceae bacterium]